MLIGVQILALIFALFMMYWAFLYYKKKELTLAENLFWQFVWLIFIFLTLFPKSLNFIITTFNITRVMDLAMIIAFMILTVLGFSNYIRQKEVEKKIERLVKEIALNIFKNKDH